MIAIGVLTIALALFNGFYVIACFAAATLCGISEANGRCGMSHIGMIAPFRKVAPGLWLRCSLAYSAGGIATSYCVGLALATVGTLLNVQTSMLFFGASGIVAALLLLRETGLIGFNPPQCDRPPCGIEGSQFRSRRLEDRTARVDGSIRWFTNVHPSAHGELQSLQAVGSRVGRRVRRGS